MQSKIDRAAALDLLKKYNKEPFHIYHALTLEGVMRYFAVSSGYAQEPQEWGRI